MSVYRTKLNGVGTQNEVRIQNEVGVRVEQPAPLPSRISTSDPDGLGLQDLVDPLLFSYESNFVDEVSPVIALWSSYSGQ